MPKQKNFRITTTEQIQKQIAAIAKSHGASVQDIVNPVLTRFINAEIKRQGDRETL
jgi:hypothetical protein